MKHIFLTTILILFIFGCAAKESVKKEKTEKGTVNALQLGLDAYKIRDYEKAKTSFLLATKQKLSKNELITAHKHLAFIYAVQGNTDVAYKEFTEAFKLNKSFNLDKSELGHPAWTPAFEWAQKESALLNASGSDLFDDGKTFYLKRDHAGAKRSLEAAVNKEDLKTSKKVEAFKLLAFIYAIQNNSSQAKNAFRKAFELDNAFQLDKAEYGNPVWTPLYDEVKKQFKKK